jgi:hypothetical protein
MKHVIADATPDDLGFVGDSWRRSYRDSPGTYNWPQAAYDAWIGVRLDELLPRCRVTVARPLDWAEGVLAWVASEQRADAYVVQWAFCKAPFRRSGLVAALIEAQQPRGAMQFSAKSFHTGATALARKFGFRFVPEASNRRKTA